MSTSIKRVAKQEFSRSFGNGFVCAVCICLFAMLIGDVTLYRYIFSAKSNNTALIISGLFKSAIIPVSLVAVALPYSTSFVSDLKSGYIRYYLPRCGLNGFVNLRFCANALSGATCVFAADVVLILLSVLLFPYMDIPYWHHNTENVLHELSYNNATLYYSFLMCLQFALFFMLSSFSLAVSAWIRNRFVPLLIPMLLENACSMLGNTMPLANTFRELLVLPFDMELYNNDSTRFLQFAILVIVGTLLSYLVFRSGVRRCAHE